MTQEAEDAGDGVSLPEQFWYPMALKIVRGAYGNCGRPIIGNADEAEASELAKLLATHAVEATKQLRAEYHAELVAVMVERDGLQAELREAREALHKKLERHAESEAPPVEECVQAILVDALSGKDQEWLPNLTRARIQILLNLARQTAPPKEQK
jgi:hypothetical protein